MVVVLDIYTFSVVVTGIGRLRFRGSFVRVHVINGHVLTPKLRHLLDIICIVLSYSEVIKEW